MARNVRVLSILNKLDTTIIPLENFLNLDDEIEKYILVLDQSENIAREELNILYPNSKLVLLSFKGNKFAKIVKIFKLKINIIHTHHTKSALIGLILKIFLRANFIHSVHSNFCLGYNKIQKIIFSLVFIFSDKIISNSIATQNSIPKILSNNKKVLIYNSIDIFKIKKYLQESKKNNSKRKEIVFGTVCRFVEIKNIPLIIKSFQKIVTLNNYDSKLVLIGSGPIENDLKNLVKKLGITKKVEFTGMLDRDNVYKRVSNFDGFIISSFAEGFCNAMVEAAALGIPILATNINPLPEVLGGYKNANFYRKNSIKDLITLMKKFFIQERLEEFKLKALDARNYVIDNYSKEKISKIYKKEYLELYLNNK